MNIPGWYQGTVTAEEIWNRTSPTLFFVQTSALLEVLHPLLGLTKTPVSSAIIQVGSRLVVLWGYSAWNDVAHSHFSMILMLFSWSMVELSRYSFYSFTCAEVEVPSFIFKLRYSLFAVLYPTGISGEIGQMYVALPFLSPVLARFTHLILALYIPFSPYMIFNMYMMRKRAMKKRFSVKRKPRPADGLVWPITNSETEERSTSITNKLIWKKSIEETDKELAKKLEKVRNWRFGYVKHVELNLRTCLKSSKSALQVAENGLKAARELFVFVRDGTEYKPTVAMKTFTDSFETGVIKGTKSLKSSSKGYKLPYKGQVYEGQAAKDIINRWVEAGTIEKTAGESIKTVIDNSEWADLSDLYFVLLGATSAMGPLNDLLNLGANIIAIDLDRPMIWERLIKQTRDSPGSLIFPMSKKQSECKTDEELYNCSGANMLSKTPEIAQWLSTVVPNEDITIGNYTYLDGGLHVQLSLASDLIMETVASKRTGKTNIAFLCTPTDVHCIPKEANIASKEHYKNVPLWQKIFEKLGVKDLVVKNPLKPVTSEDDGDIYLVDGIVSAQGPNYALAKRLQHWRSVIAHQNGQIVSTNVAPSTATKSVVSNASFAAAYEGMHLFKCMEVFFQETSSAVMLALLINDIRNDKSVSHVAAFKDMKLKNPFRLFEINSFNGGVWRCPYKMGTIGIPSALYYYLNLPSVKIFVVSGVAVIYGTVNYVLHGHPV